VGLLARRLTSGLYIHAAAITMLRHPQAPALAPAAQVGPAAGVLRRLDGSECAYDWKYHLDLLRSDPSYTDELDRAWLISALMTLADRLGAENYFDRAPVLEMVRHLRNGLAHGNRFDIREPQKLAAWPAHTRDAACRGPGGASFEIHQGLNGQPVLFDFMGPGDVLDLIISVGTHLLRH
jgi:hypothetical protein